MAIPSHAAAHVNFHWAVKGWIGAIVAVLMYVSASAGTRVLTPGMTHGPALATSFGMDLAALTALGTLMYSASQKAARARWEARQEARRLQAEQEQRERAERAEYEALAARFGRTGNGRGNALGNSRGNAAGAAWGNAPVLQPGNAGRAALPPAATAGPVVTATAETVTAARATGPMATVTDLPRRVSMSDDEMWTLAMKLAGERERPSGGTPAPPYPAGQGAPFRGKVAGQPRVPTGPASRAREHTPPREVPEPQVRQGRGRRAQSHVEAINRAADPIRALRESVHTLTSVITQAVRRDPVTGAAWAWTVIQEPGPQPGRRATARPPDSSRRSDRAGG